jgi:RNA polymerase sigma factor (sigma-70 family)
LFSGWTCPLEGKDRSAYVAAMAVRHAGKVRRFIEARLRHAVADVPDLVQEVFLRMMRLSHLESIRTPEAYLFTVAKAVLHQHRAQQSSMPEAVDITDVLAELTDHGESGPDEQLYAQQRLADLEQALSQLPRKAYVTLILNRVVGMPLDQVGAQLGISRPMAKKYLARALEHCRQRDPDMGG